MARNSIGYALVVTGDCDPAVVFFATEEERRAATRDLFKQHGAELGDEETRTLEISAEVLVPNGENDGDYFAAWYPVFSSLTTAGGRHGQ